MDCDGADLVQIEARVDKLGPYTYFDAHDDVRRLIKEVRRLQDHDVAVARLVQLAIGCGASSRALLFLQDALTELGYSRQDLPYGHLPLPATTAAGLPATAEHPA